MPDKPEDKVTAPADASSGMSAAELVERAKLMHKQKLQTERAFSQHIGEQLGADLEEDDENMAAGGFLPGPRERERKLPEAKRSQSEA